MTARHPGSALERLNVSDIRGIAKLAAQAATGVTGIAEGVHRSVHDSVGLPGGETPGRTRGITGLVYRGVRGVTRRIGKATDTVLAALQPWFETPGNPRPHDPGRDRVLAALNGVIGDRLVADGNPLAVPMTLRHRGEVLDAARTAVLPEATGRVLLLIHGLCRDESCWQARDGARTVNHGEALASALGYTPVHVRYNTGLHTSHNGRELSVRLGRLLADWRAPIERLTVVAHSMGGLVIRSAFHDGRQDGESWPDRVTEIVFLGTPHHGAPLEQVGNLVDTILAATPYTAPFARLGKLRSAGITDLRYGHVVDDDWCGRDRFERRPDARRIVPLPDGVACYAVAATTAADRGLLSDRLVGDGLVPVRSALGNHDDPLRELGFPDSAQQVIHGTSHVGLLSSPEVTRRMVRWLGGSS